MTVGDYLRDATRKLADAGLDSARLDVLILLEDALGKDRAQILAHPEWTLSDDQTHLLDQQIAKRTTHLPLAYIRGKVLFYGREFIVNEDVLVPRPETEAFITLAKTLPLSEGAKIADIGTGSGCIGISLALELPHTHVDLYDISPAALEVVQHNARNLSAPIQALQGNLLADLQSDYDIIVANLPYVPSNFPINKAASMEPSLALFSGPDGLNDYKIFWQQIASLAKKPQYILTESLPQQHHTNAALARTSGYYLEKTAGLVQLFTL